MGTGVTVIPRTAIVIGTAALLKSVAVMKAVTVAGTSLPLSHELKSIGVTLDDHLRFDSHVRAVAKACARFTRVPCGTYGTCCPQSSP